MWQYLADTRTTNIEITRRARIYLPNEEFLQKVAKGAKEKIFATSFALFAAFCSILLLWFRLRWAVNVRGGASSTRGSKGGHSACAERIAA